MEKRIEELALMLKKGSKIHIKKENRGKFTDYCGGKVTSECISRGKNSPDPKIRKRATFAANARKWKHADGGIVDSYQPSQTIVDYIKSTEGFKPNWYKDGNGIWTIGYGFTGEEARRLFKNGITRKQADEYFRKMLSERIPMLKNSTPNWEDLNQNQKDSLLSYYYNIGHGGYTIKSPALQRALKERNYKEVAKQMDFGINDKKNPGLQKRRLYEQNLFLTPINLNEKPEENNFSMNPNWTPQGSWSPYSDVKKPIWTSSFTGFHKQGGKIRAYATGNSLVYNPLGASNQNTELSPYGTLTYKPFVGVQSTGDPMLDFIYEGFTPSFPVEPVNTPVEQKDDNKEDSKTSSPTVEIDISGPEDIATGIEEPIKVEDTIIEVEDIPTEITTPVQTQNVAPEQNNNPNRPIRIPRPQQQFSPPENTTAPADATNVATIKIPKGKIEYARPNIQVGNMQELINLMVEEGISFRITSGYRPGAKTKQGRPSHHGAGNAIDITPIEGQTWDDLLSQMRRSKRFLDYMRSHKLGILDERSKEMLAQTGGTGAHFHIGPDRAAVANFEKLFA